MYKEIMKIIDIGPSKSCRDEANEAKQSRLRRRSVVYVDVVYVMIFILDRLNRFIIKMIYV